MAVPNPLRFLFPSLVSVVSFSAGDTAWGHGIHSDPAYLSWSEQACERINLVYSACGRKFDYDGKTFKFSSGLGQSTLRCTDDHRLTFYQRVDNMDIASIYMIPYVPGPIPLPETRRNHDPGRLRSQELMASVYGGSEAEVRKNLVLVDFLGQKIRFQKNLGAARALERVGKALMQEAAKDPVIAKFLLPFTGKKEDLNNYTFGWRNVKGTNRLSTHSFGTGIDLLTHDGPMYWLWDELEANPEKAKKGEGAYVDTHYVPTRKPRFPQKVIDIFEANGFIWGGKWNHYDSMHFEYRPEFFSNPKISCE